MPKPHPVDLSVGRAVRFYRQQAGLSQTQLAEALNRSFQQVQKYETGANRVSASVLLAIAKVLAIPVAALFAGAPDMAQPGGAAGLNTCQRVDCFVATAEGAALVRALPKLAAPIRRQIIALVEALAAERDDPPRPEKATPTTDAS